MIDLPFLDGQVAAVMGLGRSGLSAAQALARSGARVWAWDDNAESRAKAEAKGVALVDLAACDWNRPALLVWSPGIPHTWPQPHPVAEAARAHGRPIVCDVDLLLQARPRVPNVAITGTNGKSTTTALIGHILAQAGRRVAVGGNLGTPALDLEALDDDGIYVLELSSYQLELVPSAGFGVSILLNITPDHLGRHGGMDGYIAAKRRIFETQAKPGLAVIAIDDEPCRRIQAELLGLGRSVTAVSAQGFVKGGVSVVGGTLIDDSEGREAAILDLGRLPTLPGQHNWQNAAAAYAAARAFGLQAQTIAAGIASYPGLAHRQERVAALDGILFVNDSKATNADAAEKALGCYDTVYWIAGGLAKEGGIDSLAPLFGRIRHAFLIGQAAPAFARTLAAHHVAHSLVGDLGGATRAAYALARAEGKPGAVVLLAPACASWDQFKSFEERGERFRLLVNDLLLAKEARA
ncbi:MAG: UDP-N-acetylmuramoyl-L-alanine--D-glutamate ligase [Rhodospirillales bacterium]|nr:UDP-N-acetylmuramoyl-L-alanine--D-glutamate ligase [Rhodospirillales bacterium]